MALNIISLKGYDVQAAFVEDPHQRVIKTKWQEET